MCVCGGKGRGGREGRSGAFVKQKQKKKVSPDDRNTQCKAFPTDNATQRAVTPVAAPRSINLLIPPLNQHPHGSLRKHNTAIKHSVPRSALGKLRQREALFTPSGREREREGEREGGGEREREREGGEREREREGRERERGKGREREREGGREREREGGRERERGRERGRDGEMSHNTPRPRFVYANCVEIH